MADGIYMKKAGALLPLLVSAGLVSFFLFGGALFLGEQPAAILEALYETFLTGFGWGHILFYMTPLLFTGLSVTICYHAGLFNVGAEGQLYLGAIGPVLLSLAFPSLPAPFAVTGSILASMILGGMWGAIAGLLKTRRGSHEVITTILLNFLGIALVDYLILNPLRNTGVQNPETWAVPPAYQISTLDTWLSALGLHWFHSTPVNLTLLLAVSLCVFFHFFIFSTVWGYEMRVLGANSRTARFHGISALTIPVLAFALSGACAGLVGVNEVMGHEHRLMQGFSPQYGFTGIAVAMLARGQPWRLIPASFLLASIYNLSRELEFSSERLTKDVALILQAVIIIGVTALPEIRKIIRRRRPRA